ncbi:hypothetical protein SpCBS45565_g06203 [Spizellomyces sp. 'palustris']|nr:hypothetical protein SpCBS45565_g06203 [Spizellomyces sp. 'palustris']
MAGPKLNPKLKLILLTITGLYGGYAVHQFTQRRTDLELEQKVQTGKRYTDEEILAKWEADREKQSKTA